MAIRDTVVVVANSGWDSRVLVCRCGTLVDTFIVVTARYVVIVDTLINRETATALLDIARPYLSAARSLLVVNTHADWDHAWGNQVFAGSLAAHAAPIIASRKCAERLASEAARQKLSQKRTEFPGRLDDVVLTLPNITFDKTLSIDGGDVTLDLFATPGHTSDHISIFIPEISTLLPGDAAELPFPFVESAASVPAMRASLARMAALKPAKVLYCHAPVTTHGAALIDANSAYFDKAAAVCRAALVRGIGIPSDDDIETTVGFAYEDALPSDFDPAWRSFYQPGHRRNLRFMLQHLADATGDRAPG